MSSKTGMVARKKPVVWTRGGPEGGEDAQLLLGMVDA